MFAPLPRDLRRRAAIAATALAVITVVVYWPIGGHGFLNFDDPAYVTANPQVTAGLSWEGVRWAFTSGHAGNWHPLTWISHMADVSAFGVTAGAHHLMNLAWHLAATMILFWWLARATAAVGASAFVAAMFAVHPAHVESVAWIAERKDVLSACFWMLTLFAYSMYLRRGTRAWYAAVVAAFALGVMAKPMLVTLPFVLLLLHVWPFRPADAGSGVWRAIRPALPAIAPLVAMAIVVSVVTVVVQQQAGAVRSLEALPLMPRIGYALTAYLRYLAIAVWPVHLAPVYPVAPLSTWTVALAVVALAGGSLAAWRVRATRPAVFVGWCWFVGTLVPVIGIVQVGGQVIADRYTYLPFVGLSIAVAWAGRDWLTGTARRQTAAAAIAVAVVAAWAVTARAQVAHWRTSAGLWEHAIRVMPGNYRAHSNLGHALEAAGRVEEAIAQYQEAVRVRPTYAEARTYLGNALLEAGRTAEAIVELETAARLVPGDVGTRNALGLALAAAGRPGDALAEFRETVRLDPGFVPGHANLGVALAGQGQIDAAIAAFEVAVRGDPHSSELRTNLARARTERGRRLAAESRPIEALREFDLALDAQPAFADGHHERGRLLADAGRLDEARVALLEASRLAPGVADFHYDAAVVHHRLGRTADALRLLEAALTVEPTHAEARAAAETLLGRKKG